MKLALKALSFCLAALGTQAALADVRVQNDGLFIIGTDHPVRTVHLTAGDARSQFKQLRALNFPVKIEEAAAEPGSQMTHRVIQTRYESCRETMIKSSESQIFAYTCVYYVDLNGQRVWVENLRKFQPPR